MVNATDSKFIAEKPATADRNTSAGVLINSESEFNFTNCYFEGGDAVYVKRGTVNLNGCELKNSELWQQVNEMPSDDDKSRYTTYTFATMGACLSAESYKSANNVFSRFDITVTDCKMTRGLSNIMIYISQTCAMGASSAGINPESSINILSCTFNSNPQLMEYDIVKYANDTITLEGLNWVVG